jgi:H3 lysine-79-specific histone-lysine N-methyltransferase
MFRIEARQGANGYASSEEAAGIIAELQERATSYQPNVLDRGAKNETTYGELLPPLVTKILSWTRCTENDVLLDIGSGVGNICFQAAVQSGCSAYGIEIRPELVPIMQEFGDLYTQIVSQRELSSGRVELMQADIMNPSSEALDAISRATVIVMSNFKWDPAMNRLVFALLKTHLRVGARIVVFIPLVPYTRARKSRNQDELERFFGTPQRFTSDKNDVSWGYKPIDLYMYTIAPQEGVGLVCCMCPKKAQYVSGGVFYLCGKECQRSLYGPRV